MLAQHAALVVTIALWTNDCVTMAAKTQKSKHVGFEASATQNCTAMREPEVAKKLGMLHLHGARLAKRGTKPRLVTANHKTGTYLGMCLTRVLIRHGIKSEMASIHCSGGFSKHALQINMVRDPYSIVDSGYLYHGRNSEKWLQIPFSQLAVGYKAWKLQQQKRHTRRLQAIRSTTTKGRIDENSQAAYAAFLSLRELLTRDTCIDTKIVLQAHQTYGNTISRLPVRYGLLLEGLRALHRDIPYVVSSARDCDAANKQAAASAGCVSILLDDVKHVGYAYAFDKIFAKAFDLRDHDKIKRDFVSDCNPILKSSDAHTGTHRVNPQRYTRVAPTMNESSHHNGACTGQAHITSTCGGRAERISLLHQLDQLYLGGAISRANETIASLARRAYEH